MERHAPLAALTSAALLVFGSAFPAGAASPENEASADAAVAYFDANQLPSGGWDTSDPTDFSCGFATYDVALAIAEAGQTTETWSAAEARAAIEGVESGGNDAFDYLDDQAEGLCGGAPSVGKAAQLIVLAAAIGDDPSAFDPAGDGTPVDLVAILDAGIGDGSYGSIFTTPFAAFANVALGRPVPPATVDFLLAQQLADGGFDTGTGTDVDSTALALAALVAGGVDPAGPEVGAALRFLAGRQEPDGGFTFATLGEGANANSTGLALIAIASSGYDPGEPCWRDPGQDVADDGYVSPDQYLRSTQAGDGSWSGFSPVFSTAQAVEGLLRSWVPPVRAPARTCSSDPAPEPTTTTTTSAPLPEDPGDVGGGQVGVDEGGTGAVPGGGTAATLPATGSPHAATPIALLAGVLLLGAGTGVLVVRRRLAGV